MHIACGHVCIHSATSATAAGLGLDAVLVAGGVRKQMMLFQILLDDRLIAVAFVVSRDPGKTIGADGDVALEVNVKPQRAIGTKFVFGDFRDDEAVDVYNLIAHTHMIMKIFDTRKEDVHEVVMYLEKFTSIDVADVVSDG